MGGERWLLKYTNDLSVAAWILGYWLITVSHLGRADPSGSLSCRQVTEKYRGRKGQGKGTDLEGKMRGRCGCCRNSQENFYCKLFGSEEGKLMAGGVLAT